MLRSQRPTCILHAYGLSGAIAVPAGGGGTFLGGWIIKRFNLKLRGIVRLCAIFAVTSFFLCFGYLVQCDGTGFAGVNKPYRNE